MNKPFWKEIVSNDCQIPDGHTAAELTPELLQMLGSPDAELRDDVAYLVFARWIVRDNHYAPDELRDLIKTLTDNFSKGLGENGTDSVLLRSFSALVLSLICYKDIQSQFLTVDELRDVLDKTIAYFVAEQDIRGFIEGKGWLHSAAHTADVFKFIARNPKTTADDHMKILHAARAKLCAPVTHVYVHDEDERLVLAVLDILKRDTLSREQWVTWLEGFKAWKDSQPMNGQFKVTTHAPYMNIKHFLRSLYLSSIKLQETFEKAAQLEEEIVKILPVFGTGTIYSA